LDRAVTNDGLNWTPLETFRARDRGGWDATIPATAFCRIDEKIVEGTIDLLNVISVRPYFDEDCTTMVERAFGKSRMFADSPAARAVGFGLRVGERYGLGMERVDRLIAAGLFAVASKGETVMLTSDLLARRLTEIKRFEEPHPNSERRACRIIGIYS
jgi:hypothetical protein